MLEMSCTSNTKYLLKFISAMKQILNCHLHRVLTPFFYENWVCVLYTIASNLHNAVAICAKSTFTSNLIMTTNIIYNIVLTG